MFIVSLAIADLIVGMIVMPIAAVYIFTQEWLFGIAICQLFLCTDYIASTASILNLFILSLDRYWSVTTPLKYLRKRTKKRALIMISLVWFISSLWVVPIVGWHYFENGGIRTVGSNTCDTEYATNLALKVVTGILNFYLPLAIMYALYAKIFMEIKKRSEIELGQRSGGGAYMNKPDISRAYSSETDDTANRKEYDSDTYSDGKETSSNKLAEQRKIISRPRKSETDTDEEDRTFRYLDDCGDANKIYSGYTAINTHARDYVSDNNYLSSDGDTKLEFLYDETVIDQLTERVQPFLRGTSLSQRQSPTRAKRVTYAETCLSKSLITNKAPSRQHVQKELMLDNRHRIGRNTRANLESISNIQHNHQRRKTSSGQQVQNNSTTMLSLFPMLKAPKSKKRKGVESALMKHAMKWRKKIIKQRHKPSAQLRKEIKAARQLGVIMGAFTLCFLPYFILFMVVAFCDGCIQTGLMTAVTWVGYLNSTLNPFLYPLCNVNFRRKFRRMLFLDKEPETSMNVSTRFFTPRPSVVPGMDHGTH